MVPLSESIVVALITGGISLFGTILAVVSATKKQSADMEKTMAVMRTEIGIMKEDIKSHNRYAQMFSENIPAINQHMHDIDRRLTDLERRNG